MCGDQSNTNTDDVQNSHWNHIRARLRAEIGDELYYSWFSRLKLLAMDNGEATLVAPTCFMKIWIEQHYLDSLRAEFSIEFGGAWRITVVSA
jgi:chromosomal replication initiator protein